MQAGARVQVAVLTRSGHRTATEPGTEFLTALESRSDMIHNPVAKLRFIRTSLSRYQRLDRLVGLVPSPLVRRWLYRQLSLEGLRHLLTSNSLGGALPISRRTRLSLFLGRALPLTAAVVLLIGLAALGQRVRGFSGSLPEAPRSVPISIRKVLNPVAEELPSLPEGRSPAAIWLVERGEGWEQYSNGLRIETGAAVGSVKRRYHVFEESSGLSQEVGVKPVGILFHTSESDIWPLEASFNQNLQTSSHNIVLYVSRLKLYNYMIDRFGRVNRIVEEEDKANHAGNAIWQQGTKFYLSLNNAFLGICFETRWEGGVALPITRAQLAAGRSLTEYLRQRWEIAPEMCVTHGITSVNPRTHLIGAHVDWARGFPFEAFGLPNLYARLAPSVAAFGFGYDSDFLKVLGEPWAGVKDAEEALAREAFFQGTTVDDVRRKRQALYDRWLLEQIRDEAAALKSADRASQGPRGG